MTVGATLGPETQASTGGGGGSGTVTTVSNSDGTIVITGTPTVHPIVSRAAITGDISIPSASNVSTLATVNANVGTFGDATHVGQFTVNAKGLITAASSVAITGGGTVTTVSVSPGNGFAGVVTNPTTTPAITLSTTIIGILKGNGTAMSAAIAGTDYLSPTGSGTGLTGVLLVANNLSDVAVRGTSRFNLRVPAIAACQAASDASIGNVNIAAPGATLDGYTFVTSGSDSFLLTAQSTASQNGPWVWNGAASPATRPTDWPAAGTVTTGRLIQVSNGGHNANTLWMIDVPSSGITIDTTAQTWQSMNILGNTANEAIIRANSLNQLSPATGNYPMGGNVLTGLGAGASNGQSLRFEQIPTGDGLGAITVAGSSPPLITFTGDFKSTTPSDGEIKLVLKDAGNAGLSLIKGYATAGDTQPLWYVGAAAAALGAPGVALGVGGSTAPDTNFVRSAAGVILVNNSLAITGRPGATSVQRIVGGTASGPPATGTTSLFLPNDVIVAMSGQVWVCSPASGTTGPITNVTGTTTDVTVTAANNLVVGQTVSIAGVVSTFTNPMNGTWVVTQATATTFHVTVTSALTAGSYSSGGTVGVWNPANYATSQVIATVTGPPNTAAVPSIKDAVNVLNGSAAALAITLNVSPTPAPDQKLIVNIYDFSAVAQTLTWVNTENSGAAVPGTSNGSTTLPLTVGFRYNAATSKWRCVASI